MITPMDIHNKEFKKGFRGYSEEDVDAFMLELAGDYESIYRENRELKEKIDALEARITQFEQMEATMNNTLVLAQETADNLKKVARKEADLIIQEAEQQRHVMIEQTQYALRDAQEKYGVIRSDLAVFRTRVEAILKSQLTMLDEITLKECPIGSVVTENLQSAGKKTVAVAEEVVNPIDNEISDKEVTQTEVKDV